MEYPKEYTLEDIAWLQMYLPEDRRTTSTSTSHYLSGNEAICKDPVICILQYNLKKLEDLGDERLVTLYRNYCNVTATAEDLAIKESNLRKHIARIREKLDKLNISPTAFDIILRN